MAQPQLAGQELAATSALRSMAIGAVGLLLGGAFVLCTAYELGGSFRGALTRSGAPEAVTLTLAAAIAVLGGFSFVRGLVAREDSVGAGDAVSVALVTLVTVPLGILAIGGYAYAHPPDKQFRDPSMPYSFEYPGKWERDPQHDLPTSARSLYMAGVSKQVEGGVTQGALVQVFEHDRPETLPGYIHQQLREQALRVTDDRQIRLDGRPGFRIDFVQPDGTPYGAHVMARDGDEIYWITCIYKENSQAARKGCDKVIATFDIIGLTG